MVKLLVKIVDIPAPILLPLVIGLSFIGVYSIDSSIVDLYLLAGFGLLGVFFRRANIPAAAMVMGVVLGKRLEESMRQALAISGGSFGIFVQKPISVSLLLASVLVVLLPVLVQRLRSRS